eukprot:2681318-Pyramimonas_sp.AAC.1
MGNGVQAMSLLPCPHAASPSLAPNDRRMRAGSTLLRPPAWGGTNPAPPTTDPRRQTLSGEGGSKVPPPRSGPHGLERARDKRRPPAHHAATYL